MVYLFAQRLEAQQVGHTDVIAQPQSNKPLRHAPTFTIATSQRKLRQKQATFRFN